jgi:hypothetical protein
MTMPINLDGEKPDNVSQEQWDRLKNVFDDIYADESEEQIMSDKKLTDSEIVKALNDCKDISCNDCILCNDLCEIDHGGVPTFIIDLINHLQAEKQILEIELKAMRGAANSYKAEIERLNKDSKRLKKVQMQLDDLCKMHHIIKAEAYKEFVENAKEELHEWVGADNSISYARITKVLDNVLTGMLMEGGRLDG